MAQEKSKGSVENLRCFIRFLCEIHIPLAKAHSMVRLKVDKVEYSLFSQEAKQDIWE